MISFIHSNITARILMANGLCLIVALGAFAGLGYVRERDQIQEARFSHLEVMAKIIAPNIDGDAHAALAAAAATKDARTGGEADYEAVRASIMQSIADLNLNTPCYTLVLDPAHAAAIQANPSVPRESGLQFIVTSHQQPYFRHNYEYRPEIGQVLFEGKSVRIDPYRSSNGTWISYIVPVRNQAGEVVAAFEMDEQLDELYAAFDQAFINRVLLLALMVVLSCGVLWLVARRISQPIRELADAAENFGGGDYETAIPQQGDDEIGRLAMTLEQARSEINSFIHRILEAFPGVLLTVGTDLKIENQVSAAVTKGWGSVVGRSPTETIFKGDAGFADLAQIAFDGSSDIAFGDLLGLAPQEITHDERIYALTYSPIRQDERLAGILILGEDITEQRRLESEADADAKRSKMLLTLLGNQGLFSNFIEECEGGFTRARELLQGDLDKDGLDELFRIIHTVKGSAASLNMASLTEFAHTFEAQLDEARRVGHLDDQEQTQTDFEQLVAIQQSINDTFIEITGGHETGLLIEPEEERALRDLLAQKDHAAALKLLDLFHLPALATYLNSKAKTVVESAALATGKAARTQLDVDGIRVGPTIIKVLEGALPHLIRNAVDHGIEDEDARVDRGKGSEGIVSIAAHTTADRLVLTLSDDGKGIDPDSIRMAAVEKDLLSEDEAMEMPDTEVQMLIFAPGFSTANEVSEVSGRGVGMDAVKRRVEEAGGVLSLASTVNVGSTVTLDLPMN